MPDSYIAAHVLLLVVVEKLFSVNVFCVCSMWCVLVLDGWGSSIAYMYFQPISHVHSLTAFLTG